MLGHDLLRVSGGKGANVAVLAQRLGATTRLLACTGNDDLAEQALRGPRDAGVDVESVSRAEGATGVSTIFVAPDGDKTIVLATNVTTPGRRAAGGKHVPGSLLVVDFEVPVAVVRAALTAARDNGFDGRTRPFPHQAGE